MRLKIIWKRFKIMVSLAWKQIQDPYYQGVAAQLSFYFMFSLFPLLILLSQVMGKFGISIEYIVNSLISETDAKIPEFVKHFLQFNTAGAANIIFIASALWGASKAQFSLMRTSNYIYSNNEYTEKSYFKERFRAITTILITIIILSFTLIVVVYSSPILHIILDTLGDSIPFEIFHVRIFDYLRWPIGFAIYVFTVNWYYYMLPDQKRPFKSIIPGSIFAATSMLLATVIFSRYTALNLSNYDVLYGSLASIIGLLLWFYILAWLLCIGILLNKVWADTSYVSQDKKNEA